MRLKTKKTSAPRSRRRTLSVLLILSLAGPGLGADTAAVAASLYPCVSELARSYESAGGRAPGLVVGSSGSLSAQIAAGAPFHLFLSADLQWLRFLDEKGLLLEIVPLASSPLVLWWPQAGPAGPGALSARLRVALPDPESSPFGRAARLCLQDLGLYERLLAGGRLIITATVLQAALAAQSGAADVAFTSLSVAEKLAQEHPGAGSSLALPGYCLLHAGALVRRPGSGQAEAFWLYLRSVRAQAVWRRWGFTPEGAL